MHRIIQPPARLPFRNPIDVMDDPLGDFTSCEVRGMNQDHRDEQRFWEDEHND